MRVILAKGYAATTMQAIAAEAHASKETLYSWFGDREALVAALIRANADRTAQAIAEVLELPTPADASAEQVLERFGRELLTFLTGPVSVALNRAAMSSPALAEELVSSGRERVGGLAASYFTDLIRSGVVTAADGTAAFSLFYGLLVQDLQVGVLLGGVAPDPEFIRARTSWAVSTFLAGPAGTNEVAAEDLQLAGVRSEIDTLDADLVRLLARRQRLVERAGELKRGQGEAAVRDADRVTQVIASRRKQAAEHGLNPDLAEQVWRAMIAGFTDFELRIASAR